MANQYIIIVEFQLHSKEMMNDFLKHVNKNATESLRLELGCLRFDVLIPDDSSESIILYEIYKNKESFQFHLNAEHLKKINSNVKNLVAIKTVRQFSSTKELT